MEILKKTSHSMQLYQVPYQKSECATKGPKEVIEHVSVSVGGVLGTSDRGVSRGGQRGLEHPPQPPDQFFIVQPRAVQ